MITLLPMHPRACRLSYLHIHPLSSLRLPPPPPPLLAYSSSSSVINVKIDITTTLISPSPRSSPFLRSDDYAPLLSTTVRQSQLPRRRFTHYTHHFKCTIDPHTPISVVVTLSYQFQILFASCYMLRCPRFCFVVVSVVYSESEDDPCPVWHLCIALSVSLRRRGCTVKHGSSCGVKTACITCSSDNEPDSCIKQVCKGTRDALLWFSIVSVWISLYIMRDVSFRMQTEMMEIKWTRPVHIFTLALAQ
jgi:hypothetical protein